MIAVYTIQIQSSNNKIKSMGLKRININISKRFVLAGICIESMKMTILSST